ncbi:MAG: hypothetical protein ACYSR9_04240 [Planctomycetota bacterium]|jgi:hypothetical protein
MNPIRRKMASFLTEAAHKEIEALDMDCPCAKEMSKLDDVDNTIAEEVNKLCDAATLREISKTVLLVGRLKKASLQEKEAIESELRKIAEELVRRVEAKSGPSRLRETCRGLLLDI